MALCIYLLKDLRLEIKNYTIHEETKFFLKKHVIQ